jgi:glycine/D-amino acid oxidase-like deaminating enzyme
MARSYEIFQHADEYLGAGAAQALHIKERGYLFSGFTAAQADALKAEVAHLQSIGLTHLEYLDTDEVQYRYGWLGKKIIAAKFDPQAGWLDSNALIHRYIQSAKNAKLLLSAGEIRIQLGTPHTVHTAHGSIQTPKIVIACGANARQVARTAGIELPIIVRPRQSVTVGTRHKAFPADAPMIIGATPHPHVRPEAQSGAILGWEYTWRPKNYAHLPHGADYLVDPVYPVAPLRDPRYPSLVLTLLARQFGHDMGQGFADACYLRNVYHNIGYYVFRDGTAAYATNADGSRRPYDSERAILDQVPQVEGVYASIAHVGHGIMTSPAAGEIMACKVLERPLPDPLFAQFSFDTVYAEYDEAVL